MVGVVHEEINLKSSSGIIHGCLIVLVRPKHVLRTTQSAINEFLQNLRKLFITAKFLLPHCWMHSVKCSGKLAITKVLLFWRNA